MSLTSIIPMVGQLLNLSLRIADIIDKSGTLNAEDRAALKSLIKEAKDGVTYIETDGENK